MSSKYVGICLKSGKSDNVCKKTFYNNKLFEIILGSLRNVLIRNQLKSDCWTMYLRRRYKCNYVHKLMKLWRRSVDDATTSNRKFLWFSFIFCSFKKWKETNQRGDGNDKRKRGTFSRLALWSMFFFRTTNSRLLFHIIWSPSQRNPPNKYVQMHLFLLENSDIYLCRQLKKQSKT